MFYMTWAQKRHPLTSEELKASACKCVIVVVLLPAYIHKPTFTHTAKLLCEEINFSCAYETLILMYIAATIFRSPNFLRNELFMWFQFGKIFEPLHGKWVSGSSGKGRKNSNTNGSKTTHNQWNIVTVHRRTSNMVIQSLEETKK